MGILSSMKKKYLLWRKRFTVQDNAAEKYEKLGHGSGVVVSLQQLLWKNFVMRLVEKWRDMKNSWVLKEGVVTRWMLRWTSFLLSYLEPVNGFVHLFLRKEWRQLEQRVRVVSNAKWLRIYIHCARRFFGSKLVRWKILKVVSLNFFVCWWNPCLVLHQLIEEILVIQWTTSLYLSQKPWQQLR